MSIRIACTAVTLALLAGCAAQPAAPPAAAPPPAAPAASTAPLPPGTASPFDGLYKSARATAMSKGRIACNVANAPNNLRIRNGMASMTWRGHMTGQVGADGSLTMSDPGDTLTGAIANDAFSGTLETPICRYTIVLTKS